MKLGANQFENIITEGTASNKGNTSKRREQFQKWVILYHSNLPINILSFELIYSVLTGTVDCLEKNRDVE